MRSIEKILFHGSAYTVLLLTVYYVFSALNTNSPTVSLARFLLIALFGFIIAAAEFVYAMTELRKWLRHFIHYTILLIAFCVIFLTGGFIENRGPATVFAMIIIFTAFYFAILGLTLLVRKSLNKADDKLDRTVEKKAQKAKTASDKNKYTPRFK